MKVTAIARHLPMTAALKAYAEERAGRLEHFFDRARNVEVVLAKEGDLFTAEMIVGASRHVTIVGRAREKDLYAAIDLVTDKIERQLTKVKELVRGKRARGAGRVRERTRVLESEASL